MIKTYGDRQPGLGTSAIVGALTLAKTGTTARTATFPDAAITVAGSASALTSGRVPYVTTGGLLTDDASLTYSAASGNLSQTFSANGAVQYVLTNTDGAGASASATINVRNGASPTADLIVGAYGAGRTGTQFGVARANAVHIFSTASGTTSLLIGHTASSGTIIIGSNNAAICTFTTTGITAAQSITVPNGTAAAPGIRLTSEASGLYRVSATSLGFTVAGTAAASLTSAGALSAASLTVTGGASAAATVYKSATFGLAVQLATGSSYDGGFLKPDASAFLWYIPTGTGNVVFPSGSIVVGTTALAGSERARFTGGTMGTPGATDVLIGGGAVSCGATLSATGLRATTGFHEGPINGGITFNAYYSAGWKYRSNGYASALTDNAASGVILQVAPTGLADAAISWQAVFTGTPTTLGFASAIVSTFNNTTDATTTSDGSVRLAGGLSVLKAGVFGGAVTVPNGTAAAPGIRTTTYAHGLHSIGATSVGIDVAGALVLTVGATASSFASGTTVQFSNTTTAGNGTGSVICNGGGYFAKAVFAANDASGVHYYGNAGLTMRDQGSATTTYLDLAFGSASHGAYNIRSSSGATVRFNIDTSGHVTLGGASGNYLNINNATGELRVNGTKVITAQGAAVADATGAGDVVAQLNALLARCRAHGLIAT